MSSYLDSSASRAPTRRRQADRRAKSRRRLIRAVVDIIPVQGVSAPTFKAIGARSDQNGPDPSADALLKWSFELLKVIGQQKRRRSFLMWRCKC